jgi:hypothetical protein
MDLSALIFAALKSARTANERIDALPLPMVFKGTLGTGGTIETLPTASSENEGFVYIVITDGTYASQSAKAGDMFISDGASWVLVPSSDEPSVIDDGVTSTALTWSRDKISGHVEGNADGTPAASLSTLKIGDTLYQVDGKKICYGFHIDSAETDADDAVTYLEDAVGMTPAYMDYANDKFVYGSWENAFFMPRPCMLKSDGTVDYYLDKNDYSKKEDGTASDIANDAYDGNAMMEWGKIWYKVVPDANDDASVSVYISDRKLDGQYHAWSNLDDNGNAVEHFYTPIYNGSIVNDGTNDVLRSLSGKTYEDLCQNKTATDERTMAQRNGSGWDTEVYCDYIVMSYLLILISKSLDTSGKFGNGRCGQASDASSMLGTGTMDTKGMFWGSNTNDYGVKVFGMENQWSNQWRRFCGLILDDNVWKYKLTKSTADGSAASDYNTEGTNYLTQNDTAPAQNYVQKMYFNEDGSFYDKETSSSSSTRYKDYFYVTATDKQYAVHGGYCASTAAGCGAFFLDLNYTASSASWRIGASVSYR